MKRNDSSSLDLGARLDMAVAASQRLALLVSSAIVNQRIHRGLSTGGVDHRVHQVPAKHVRCEPTGNRMEIVPPFACWGSVPIHLRVNYYSPVVLDIAKIATFALTLTALQVKAQCAKLIVCACLYGYRTCSRLTRTRTPFSTALTSIATDLYYR